MIELLEAAATGVPVAALGPIVLGGTWLVVLVVAMRACRTRLEAAATPPTAPEHVRRAA